MDLTPSNAVSTRFLTTAAPGARVLAVRDDSLALVGVPSSDGDRSFLLVEDRDGALLATTFAAVELHRAVVALEEAWVEAGLTTSAVERPEPFLDFIRGHLPVTEEPLRRALSDDFRVVAHNRFGGVDNADKEKKIVDLVAAADVFGVPVPTTVLGVSAHAILSHTELVQPDGDGAGFANPLLVMLVERDGQIVLQEQWDVEALADAVARFDEVDRRGGA